MLVFVFLLAIEEIEVFEDSKVIVEWANFINKLENLELANWMNMTRPPYFPREK